MRKIIFLCLGLVFFSQIWSQTRVIRGRILDNNGNPLSGATVLIKGTNTGTATADDGSFTLTLPSDAAVLNISQIGFQTEDIVVGNRTDLIIRMEKPKANGMEEIVVVAYGTSRKEALTGSVGVIKAEAIQKRPVGNVVRTIEGAVAGVVTTSGSGQPGNGNSIRVRGFGSINATSEPLFVVDGIPYVGGSSNINPDDVESVSVLKDAASTALYGSRAANGVIMITTKKGKRGRNNVSMRLMQGVAARGLQEYDRVGPSEYYSLMWEAYRNSLVYRATGAISMDSANRVASGLTNRTSVVGLLAYNPFNVPANSVTDVSGRVNPNAQLIYADDLNWERELIRNGVRRDYNINFNGGSDKSDYFLSLGYLNEGGYVKRTDFTRYSGRLNVNVQPLAWLKTGLNISGNFSTSNSASEGGGLVNPFSFTRNIAPIYPVYAHNMRTGAYVLDDKGNRIWDLGNFLAEPIGIQNSIPNRAGTTSGRHALAELMLNEALFRRTVLSGRSATEISFLKHFKFTNNLSVDFETQNDIRYENTLVGDGAPAGRSTRTSTSSTGFIASQLLTFNRSFSTHRIEALVGHESFNQYDNNLNGQRQSQSLTGNIEFSNFTTINSLGSSVDRYRIESYFSRINYDFDSRYLLSASLRRDGNSRFSPDARWGTFWSVGGGWNLHKEKFLSNARWIDNLKVRSTYGVVGVADGIGFYAYQGLYVFANNALEPGIVQSQTAFLNRELTWEENKQFDVGLDFSFFKNRISGSVEYYRRESADLLFAVPQPLSSGALSVQQNTATMFNKGVEVSLSTDVIRSKNFVWNNTINLSTVMNRITKMPATVPEFITGTKKYAVGSSIFDYWLRNFYGVDPADGSALYVAQNTAPSANTRLITNKSGGVDTVTTAIANARFSYMGTAIPDFYGSFSPSVRYKGFSLSALFVFQIGGKTYDANYQDLMSSGTYGSALHVDALKRWQKPGDVTDVPRMDNGRTVDFDATSSRWLIDASFINIRTLTLSYDLPKTLLSRMGMTSASFFLGAENVAFFSKRKGMNNQTAFTGVTGNGYPPARIITTGIMLNL